MNKEQIIRTTDVAIQAVLLAGWAFSLAFSGDIAFLGYFVVGGFMLISAIVNRLLNVERRKARLICEKFLFGIGIFWAAVAIGLYTNNLLGQSVAMEVVGATVLLLAVAQAFLSPFLALLYFYCCLSDAIRPKKI